MRSRSDADVLVHGLMRINEVVEFLGISRPSVYELMANGQLPYTIIGHNRRIPRKAVMDLAAERLVVTKEQAAEAAKGADNEARSVAGSSSASQGHRLLTHRRKKGL